MLTEADYFGDRSERLLHELEREQGLSRRRLLQLGASGIALLAGASRLIVPDRALATATGPIVKPLPPEWFVRLGTNAEMRWDAARELGYRIPNERFFVRNHTSTPLIDASSWRLRVFGSGLRDSPALGDAVQFSLDDLRHLPSTTRTAFIECAGNGRSFFGTQQGSPAPGSQWTLGAIGLARWRGVALSEVLDRAGIRPRAVDVMPAGLDPEVVTAGVDQGHVRRPLPVGKALDDVLLAYEMNGEPLPPDHGFPVRLVVPGWVGIASIKWLGRIEVADKPLFSPWNTTQYRMVGPQYPADSPPLTNQTVKSALELALGAKLALGRQRLLTGRSWSGNGRIRRLEVSTDGGRSWHRARLEQRNPADAWVRWSHPWRPTAAGNHVILTRATDTAGNTQPVTVPFNELGYLFGAIVAHPVVVG